MSYYDDADERVYDYMYDADDIDDLELYDDESFDDNDYDCIDDDSTFMAEYESYYHDVADEIVDD